MRSVVWWCVIMCLILVTLMVCIYIYKGLMAGVEDFFEPIDNTCLNTISSQNALSISGFDTDFIYTIRGSSSYRPKSLRNEDTTLCPGIR